MILIILIILIVIVSIINFFIDKNKKFVLEHSIAINKLKDINKRYEFKTFNDKFYFEAYDNEDFYNDIKPIDLLIYNLINDKEIVKSKISVTLDNINQYSFYSDEVETINKFGLFDAKTIPLFEKSLLKMEKRLFDSMIKKPKLDFIISVKIIYQRMNKEIVNRKKGTFGLEQICNILDQIENKIGNFYCDKEVWEAICRVERGKVKNELRFKIYKRDGNRCLMCGSTDNLEIDHIIPISKGGKSTFDNLQTLCKECNLRKANHL